MISAVLRAVLFDFNGVLVDDEPVHFELLSRVLAEEGVELTRKHYYHRFLGLDDRACFDQALSEAGQATSAAGTARLVARKASYYHERMRRDGYPFFAGAPGLVQRLAAAGLPLGVVSGALREEVEGALAQAGIGRLFKVLVTAEDTREGKPDPEGYRAAIEALNTEPPLPDRMIHPHEVLAIEDSSAGLAAATGAGLSTLAVAHTYPASVLADADLVVERIGEIELEGLLARFAEG